MNKVGYAKNDSGDMVNISTVKKDSKEKYFCIGCNNELIPKLGNINKHHFCHKVNCECNGETYLHKTAKNLFYTKYIECLDKKEPFFVEYITNKVCSKKNTCKEQIKLNYDLTKHFDLIKLEKKDSEFIPDVLLYSSKHETKIYIEIKVTHKCSTKKVNSKNKIIEFEIKDEKDFNFKKYKFINFEFNEHSKACDCNASFRTLLIDIDKKAIIKFTNPTETNYNEFTYYDFIDNESYLNAIYKRQRENKIDCKNCIVCKKAYVRDNDDVIKCSLLNHNIIKENSNNAVTCESFELDVKESFGNRFIKDTKDLHSQLFNKKENGK